MFVFFFLLVFFFISVCILLKQWQSLLWVPLVQCMQATNSQAKQGGFIYIEHFIHKVLQYSSVVLWHFIFRNSLFLNLFRWNFYVQKDIYWGSTVDKWFAHPLHSSEVSGSDLGSGLPVCRLRVPLVLAFVSYGYPCFLPNSKSTHVTLNWRL